MRPETSEASTATGAESRIGSRDRYEPPTYEVVCLACEISAYAPDGDTPLF